MKGIKRYSNNCIMLWGDLHAPYQHKHAVEFLADIKSTYNPDRVVCTGDILDMYSISAYPKDINHKDAWSKEIKDGRKVIKTIGSLFPKMNIVSSNHDDRPARKAGASGIPREMLVPYREVIGAPEAWKWNEQLTLTVDSTRDKIFIAHHKTGGALACAKDYNCTAVLGHSHSKFGMTGFKVPSGKLIYGVDAGCLISDKGSPFKYNKGDRSRPIQGCCMIMDGIPHMIPLG